MAATPPPKAMGNTPLPYGEIHTKKKASTRRGFFYDICLGICEHGRFAPYIAEEPHSPSII